MWQEGLKRSVRLRANVDLMSKQVRAVLGITPGTTHTIIYAQALTLSGHL